MKYKKMKAYLEGKQAWFDKLPQSIKNGLKRPGSVKTR